MQRLKNKEKVLAQAKLKQQALIDDFENRISEIRGSEMNMHKGQFDRNENSLNEANMELVDKLADQLDFAVKEMELLNKMELSVDSGNGVCLGTIVLTDQRTFFPSVSIESFDVDGLEIFGISQHAPLYQEMRGKKPGDRFSFAELDYEVKAVF